MTEIKKGLFITFEGVDGCGKSTQANLLFEYLKSQNIPVILTKEPGGTPEGQAIRTILLDKNMKLPPISETLLFYADRAKHVQDKIVPYLEKGFVVISDRFSDSTFAYQSAVGLDFQTIQTIHHASVGDLLPNKTFVLDLPSSKMQERFAKRESLEDRMEARGLSYFSRVGQNFLEIAFNNPERMVVLDATETIQKIHENIKKEFHKLQQQ